MARRIHWTATIAATIATIVAVLAGPASAAVSPPLGRTVVAVDYPGNPSKGHGVCSAQGQRVDANDNGFAEGIQGRAACLESYGVTRYRINWVALQVDFADTWLTVARRDLDAVSASQPAYVVSKTPVDRFCSSDTTTLTYRVTASVTVRWTDGTLSSAHPTSHQFSGRRTVSHPDCPD